MNSRRIRLTIAFLVLPIVSFAQPSPDTLWTRTYGSSGFDSGYDVEQTADGGYAVVGIMTQTTYGGHSLCTLIRLRSDGDTLWSRSFGEAYQNYPSCSVHQLQDGGFIIGSTGYRSGQLYQFKLIRTDSLGNELWEYLYGGDSYDIMYGMHRTSDGGFIMAGYTTSYGTAGDAYIVKADSMGQIVWERNYGDGGSRDEARSVLQTLDGGYIVCGASGGGGWSYAYLVRLNSFGDSLWTQTYPDGLVAYDVAETATGGYWVTGKALTANNYNCMVLKVDDSGNLIWSRQYDGPENMGNWGKCVLPAGDGGCAIAGTTGLSQGGLKMYLTRISGAGYQFWFRYYGSSSRDFEAYDFRKTSDGGYILIGYDNAYGNSQIFTVKTGRDVGLVQLTAPNGGEQWNVFHIDTVRWIGYGFAKVRIELNRSYPSGTWEVLHDSTENDGLEAVYVSDPLSTHCRIRISSVADTITDISDADFSIAASQGYLALVRQAAPSTPILNWTPVTVECPQIGTEWFLLKNFGSEAVLILEQLEPENAEFALLATCTNNLTLAPGQMSPCSLRLTFDPASDGTFHDTLLIQTDAINGVNGYIRIPLSGSQISTPVIPQIVITAQGQDARLNWNRVVQSTGGCPINTTEYLVFFSQVSGGPFWYHGHTTDTTYVHYGVVSHAPSMFYHVIASTAPVSLLQDLPPSDLNPPMSEAQVLDMLRTHDVEILR